MSVAIFSGPSTTQLPPFCRTNSTAKSGRKRSPIVSATWSASRAIPPTGTCRLRGWRDVIRRRLRRALRITELASSSSSSRTGKAAMADSRVGSPANTPDAISHETMSPAPRPKRRRQKPASDSSGLVREGTRISAAARSFAGMDRRGVRSRRGEDSNSSSSPSVNT
jgi:hypothetical protein